MDEKNSNGGPAFPQHGWSSNPEIVARMQDQGGMTLRDYFAAKACAAIVGSLMNRETWHGWSNPEIAKEAYDVADAMLAVRSAA